MVNKRKLYEEIMTDVAKTVKSHLEKSITSIDPYYDISEHLVVEMATFGQEKWGKNTYKMAIHGASTKDRETPHIHIYYANDTNLVHPQFNFEISLLDILTKDEINIIFQLDKSKHIARTNRRDCNWQGYRDLYNGFKSFLFSKPTPSKKGGDFIDNLDRAIHEWNRETDLNGYENLGKNPLKDYIEGRNLEILPQYQKYFEE